MTKLEVEGDTLHRLERAEGLAQRNDFKCHFTLAIEGKTAGGRKPPAVLCYCAAAALAASQISMARLSKSAPRLYWNWILSRFLTRSSRPMSALVLASSRSIALALAGA